MAKLNSRHFIFIIMGTSIVSLKTYPNLIIKEAGRDSWIAVILASVIIFFFTLYILWICKKTNCYDLFKIFTSLGKVPGTILLFLYCISLFLTLIESSSIQASSMHENMLLETPPWFILLFFLLTSVYSIKKGLKALVIISVLGITFIMFAGMNLGVMTIKYKNPKYILPILAYGLDLDFWVATLKAVASYASITVFLPFLSKISDKPKLIKNTMIALIIVIQMEIISTMGVITSFGPKRAQNIWYPKLIQTQLVSYFGFLESGEFFVMLQIVGGWFIKYILTFYALLTFLKKLEIFNKYSLYIITLLVFFISYWVSKDIFTLFKLLDYYLYIALLGFLLIPFIVFTVFLFKSTKR
jgi:spore germination protein (amino acid permease)